jgi:hypothetical protein
MGCVEAFFSSAAVAAGVDRGIARNQDLLQQKRCELKPVRFDSTELQAGIPGGLTCPKILATVLAFLLSNRARVTCTFEKDRYGFPYRFDPRFFIFSPGSTELMDGSFPKTVARPNKTIPMRRILR